MASTQDLLRILDDFRSKPESRGYDLRLSLAEIVLRQLRTKGWTQKQLADAAGMKPSFLTRIIHGSSNCTFDVAGRILFALGVHAELVDETPSTIQTLVNSNRFVIAETKYGQDEAASFWRTETPSTVLAPRFAKG